MIFIPIYFIIVSSFKENIQIFGSLLKFPLTLNLAKYVQALKQGELTRAIIISISVTAGAEILTLLLAFPAAYAIARIPTRLAILTESFFGLGFLIPALAILMPVFLLAVRIGLLYDPLMLVIFYPATKLSLSVILLSSFLRKIPHEIEESAEMDGANRLQRILYIFFPLAQPAVITVLVLNFIDIWNEYLFSLILMNQQNRTIQIAVSSLKSERLIDYGLVTAGAVISIIPVFIMFVFFQERIMQGMLAGALKG